MRLEAVVHGRVQGVGYRLFAAEKAGALGLKGYAKNLPNESVEVVAEGNKRELELFLKELEKGPPLARVEKVSVRFSDAKPAFKKFEIRH